MKTAEYPLKKIPSDTHRKLKVIAALTGVSINTFLLGGIEALINDFETENGKIKIPKQKK